MLQLRQAFRFSFSLFTAYLSLLALLVYIVFALTGLLVNSPKFVLLCTGLVYIAAFVRILIVAKKSVFEVPNFLYCSKSFYLKQLGIIGIILLCLTFPIWSLCLLKNPFTMIITVPLMLPVILISLSGYMKNFYPPSLFHDALRVTRKRKDLILMIVYSVIAIIVINSIAALVLGSGLIFLDDSIIFFENYLEAYRIRFLLLGGFCLYGVYVYLPKKYRADMIISSLLVVPSIALFVIAVFVAEIKFEVSLFLLVIFLLQILWYVIFFTFLLQFASLAFVCHLMAQVCLNSSVQSKGSNYKRNILHRKNTQLLKGDVKQNYFSKNKS